MLITDQLFLAELLNEKGIERELYASLSWAYLSERAVVPFSILALARPSSTCHHKKKKEKMALAPANLTRRSVSCCRLPPPIELLLASSRVCRWFGGHVLNQKNQSLGFNASSLLWSWICQTAGGGSRSFGDGDGNLTIRNCCPWHAGSKWR